MSHKMAVLPLKTTRVVTRIFNTKRIWYSTPSYLGHEYLVKQGSLLRSRHKHSRHKHSRYNRLEGRNPTVIVRRFPRSKKATWQILQTLFPYTSVRETTTIGTILHIYYQMSKSVKDTLPLLQLIKIISSLEHSRLDSQSAAI
jgi:hypothetical protein